LQDGRCAICASLLEKFDAHHMQPWHQGGLTKTENLQLLCKLCHNLSHFSYVKDSKI
jgi:hypothetical protein